MSSDTLSTPSTTSERRRASFDPDLDGFVTRADLDGFVTKDDLSDAVHAIDARLADLLSQLSGVERGGRRIEAGAATEGPALWRHATAAIRRHKGGPRAVLLVPARRVACWKRWKHD